MTLKRTKPVCCATCFYLKPEYTPPRPITWLVCELQSDIYYNTCSQDMWYAVCDKYTSGEASSLERDNHVTLHTAATGRVRTVYGETFGGE